MTTTPSTPGAPITHKRQLVEYLEAGCKPPAAWRVGTEHEKFVFRRSDLRRVPYEGPDGIAAVVREMTRFGWKPIVDHTGARRPVRTKRSATRDRASDLRRSA